MKIFNSFEEINIEAPTGLTLGKFDGVHLGHQELIKRLDGRKAVFTFDITNGKDLITTKEERHKRFEELGIDYLFECPFSLELMHMAPEAFADKIVKTMKVRRIVTGTDFRFGFERGGDYRLLQKLAPLYGYETEVVEKLVYDGREISSTFIREELNDGRMEHIKNLLGCNYYFDGQVVSGNRLGRTIGIPTANIMVDPHKLCPPFGVYAATLKLGSREIEGVANIGRKPTIVNEKGINPIGIEINLFDFNEDIYGEDVRIYLYEFIRPEVKFESLDLLKLQIEKDVTKCYKIFRD